MGLAARLVDLAWRGSGRVWSYNRHWISGTPSDRVDEDAPSKEPGGLPDAELSEEERKRAVEELQRKPRIK